MAKAMAKVFLSYARGDDEPFVRRLHKDLKKAGFDVWFDRVSMPSRLLTFYQEIRDAIAARERLILVVGPKAVVSDYATQEWQFAYFAANKCVNPIVRLDGQNPDGRRLDGYELMPEDLKLLHAEDFRDDARYAEHLKNLVRQLREPLSPVGKLVAVPELPPGYRAQPERLKALRDMLLIDLRKPVVVTGAAARVGLQGMGGIGKSVLANALAHHPEVQRAFKDNIYWIAFGQTPPIEDLQRWLARQLGDEGLFSDRQTGKERLRQLLADRAVLLILDDVWDREHADAFNVVGPLGRILLTTRDAGLVTALAARENHYRVELPTQAEAEALLASAAEVAPDDLPPEARQVITQCGRLPLALALCGGMVHGGTAWPHVLAALRDHNLEFLSSDHPAEEQHRNAWIAMDVSLRVLPQDKRDRFAELAVFGLDAGAPEAAVATLWEHTAGMKPYETGGLLAELARRSLVQRVRPAEGDAQAGVRMNLHDLLHNFAEGMAAKRFGTIVALHQVLLDAYWKKCTDGWHAGPNDGYFFDHLAWHLLEAGRAAELWELLMNYLWIRARLRATDALAMIGDYDLLSPGRKEPLGLIQGALRLSAHVLSRDRRELPTQVTARLLGLQPPRLEALLQQVRRDEPDPWLRSLSGSLTAPGGPLLQTLEGHGGHVEAVAVMPDGRRAVSASGDKTLKVWDLESGACLRTLEGHRDTVSAVAAMSDGRRALSGSRDTTLKLWDLESGNCLRTLEGHGSDVEAVAVTPDGRRALSGSRDTALKFWDLESGNCLRTLGGHGGWVRDIALMPDGRRAISVSEDKMLKIWDLESGICLRTLAGHDGAVETVAVTPDGRRAISGSADTTLKVWDLELGDWLWTLEGHRSPVLAVAVTPDGRRAISGSLCDTLKVWDLESGVCLQTLEGSNKTVRAVAVTPDGRRAISGSDDTTLKVWDLELGDCLVTMEKHDSAVETIAVTPDGRRAVSGSWDKMLKVWDLESGICLRTLEGHDCVVVAVAVTPDGRQATSVSGNKTLVVWALETGACLQTLEGRNEIVSAVAFMPDGRRAVSASSWSRTLKVWDLESGICLRTLEGHSREVRAVAVTPDGRRAVSGSDDKTLKVWDLEAGACLRTLEGHGSFVGAVAVTPDGRRAVSGSWDDTLKVWDLETGDCLRTVKAHSGWISAIAVMPDGRRVISGSCDQTLKVWNLASGATVASFTGEDEIHACAVGPDGVTIVAGDRLGRMHFLRLEGV